MRTFKPIGTLAALALAAWPVSAQLADASASALAVSGNNTATVRGFAAISTNPAGLAMPGSGFSLALAPVQFLAGLGPISLGDLADFQGRLVPAATKEEWLTAIEAAGGQSGDAGFEVSAIALTFGNIGFQLSTVASARFNLPAGAAEAVLFGNGGRADDGTAADLDLTGLGIDAFAISTAAVSVGFGAGPAQLGVTGKYMVGHGLALTRATSGSISTNPIRVSLEVPTVGPCDDEIVGVCSSDFVGGSSGVGLDLGFMMDLPSLSIGAALQNVVNTFSWDDQRLSFRPGTALFEENASDSDFDETSYDSAPAELKALVEAYTIKPSLRLGAALDLPMALTVSADIHRRLSGEGIAFGPQSHVGVGAEFRGLGILHVRAGTAVVTGGTQISGGASLLLGPINLSLAVAKRQGDQISDTAFGQFTLSFGNR